MFKEVLFLANLKKVNIIFSKVKRRLILKIFIFKRWNRLQKSLLKCLKKSDFCTINFIIQFFKLSKSTQSLLTLPNFPSLIQFPMKRFFHLNKQKALMPLKGTSNVTQICCSSIGRHANKGK